MTERLKSEGLCNPVDEEAMLRVQNEKKIYTFDTSKQSVVNFIASQNVLLLGVPGAGKTTLASSLHDIDNAINYISLGDISRNLQADSPERLYLDELFSRGAPIGDPQFFLRLIEPYIDHAIQNGRGFILDGLPKKKEEVEPLMDFLTRKDLSIDTVISCEVDPLEAYDRVSTREKRTGDHDTMEIFANRTRLYLENLDNFKKSFTRDGAKLVELDMGILTKEQCVDHLLATYRISSSMYQRPLDLARISDEIERGAFHSAAAQIAPLFDDNLSGKIPYADIFSPEVERSQKEAIVQEAMIARDPQLRNMPLLASRLAHNYLSTTIPSIEHLITSLIDEVRALGRETHKEDISRLVHEQLQTKRLIEEMQRSYIDNKDFDDIVDEEIVQNSDELSHISSILRDIADRKGYSNLNLEPEAIMRVQPLLWGQFTSRKVLFAPDTNYRRTANGEIGSHHSLLPYTRAKRALAANSMANYVPFIEAVSSSEYKYSSTFGFIHLIGCSTTGEAFGVEYPIMMHDRRLLDLKNERLNRILSSIDSFYSTHDIWHNMIPVYADHFILHHIDAPLSLGGRRAAYVEFGKQKRIEKEEYEIGVAMAHAKTQQERFEADPELRASQIALITDAIDELPLLREELKAYVSECEVDDILDFLSSHAASNLFNILPPTDEIYTQVDQKLRALNLPPLSISIVDVAELMVSQRLIDVAQFGSGIDSEALISTIRQEMRLARQIIEKVDTSLSVRESGSEYIVQALNDFGILQSAIEGNDVFQLEGMNRVRWIAMMAPQRQQLKGHMEKVHGKNGAYVYGDKVLDDARELVHLQQTALQADMSHYLYRMHARKENQQLGYGAYSLCFDDGQELHRSARDELTRLLHSDDASQTHIAQCLVVGLDKIIDSLVKLTYDFDHRSAMDLIDYTKVIANSGYVEVASTIEIIIRRYDELRKSEQLYQMSIGTTYNAAITQILNDQMSIS